MAPDYVVSTILSTHFEHPRMPHSWEKHRKRVTILGDISRDEVVQRVGSPAAQAILAVELQKKP